MSDSRPPGPPPAGSPPPPPSGPPTAGPPPAGPPPSSPSRLGWYVAGGVLVLMLGIGGAVFAFTGGEASSVQEVADQAVEAAEDLDVGAGIDLLCKAPTKNQRAQLEFLIAEGQQEAGTEDPDMDYVISHVEGDATGSFRVRATSDEEALQGRTLDLVLLVEQDDGRSCIAGVKDGQMVGEDGD
ncbi:hypothetical protein LRP67_14900 [Nocardioides sp. cx-169]|uniref:hypothetical protein n=1 Tax=Nocardioides sp. cx-169 TaxID=2899080 RepID=UPI001E4451BE|nr:hypothetical protein [Nocardioides sp. cx-169]MCD4535380.1 hypothetical protein [Nocardioides sp. cx-169]